jgi:hypothetical protein
LEDVDEAEVAREDEEVTAASMAAVMLDEVVTELAAGTIEMVEELADVAVERVVEVAVEVAVELTDKFSDKLVEELVVPSSLSSPSCW